VINSNWHPISIPFSSYRRLLFEFWTLRFRTPFGGIGSTYTICLRFIGKRVVDFLLVLIELLFAFSSLVCAGIPCSAEKTFSTLSGVWVMFWILLQLDILCTSAVKRCHAKKWKFTFHESPVFPCIGIYGSKKTLHRVVRISVWLISYSEDLCNKKCIVKTPETLIIWSACC